MQTFLCKKKIYIRKGSNEVVTERSEVNKESYLLGFEANNHYHVINLFNDSELTNSEADAVADYCSFLTGDEIDEKWIYFFATNGELVLRCNRDLYLEIRRYFKRVESNRKTNREVLNKIKERAKSIIKIIEQLAEQVTYRDYSPSISGIRFYDYEGIEIMIGDVIEGYRMNKQLIFMGIGFYCIQTHEVITCINWFCFQRVPKGIRLTYWRKVKTIEGEIFKRIVNKAIVDNSRASKWLNKMINNIPRNNTLARHEFYPKTAKVEFNIKLKIKMDQAST